MNRMASILTMEHSVLMIGTDSNKLQMKMLRQIRITLLACVFVAMASSCSWIKPYDNARHAVEFSTRVPMTKTAYGTGSGKDKWQLYWSADDQIKIYSGECTGSQEAVYDITPGDPATTGVISHVDEDNQLCWDENNPGKTYDFFAHYPYNGSKVTYDRTTKVLSTKVATSQSGNLDMTDVYLIAKKTGVTKEGVKADPVLLDFNAACTVLEITLQGVINNNSESAKRTVTNVEFATEITRRGDWVEYDYGNTQYNGTKQSTTITWTPSTTLTINGSASTTPETATFAVALNLTEDVSTTNPLTITVNCGGGETYVATVKGNIRKHDKKKVIMPCMIGTSYKDGMENLEPLTLNDDFVKDIDWDGPSGS